MERGAKRPEICILRFLRLTLPQKRKWPQQLVSGGPRGEFDTYTRSPNCILITAENSKDNAGHELAPDTSASEHVVR